MNDVVGEYSRLILQWRDDPELFVRQVLGGDPFPWQARALCEYRDYNRLAIKSGKGVGKSALIAWILLHFLCTRNEVKVACTATTASQLYDVLWAEVRKWRDGMGVEYKKFFPVEITSDRVYLEGMELNFAIAKTARREQPEALQGIHSKNTLFLIDEASGVPDEIFAVAEGAMSTEGAKVVMTGNPTRTDGYFYDAFHADYQRWRRITVSGKDSPAVTGDYLEYMLSKWGETSNEYRVGVMGEFPISGMDDKIIPRGLLDAARGRVVEGLESEKVYWGVDVASGGGDRFAVAKRRGRVLLEPVVSWSGKDIRYSRNRLRDMYMATPDDMKPVEIFVDKIGAIGFPEWLADDGLPARGINVANVSTQKGKYHRLRDELWFRARTWFEGGDVSIPHDDDLIAELNSVEYYFKDNGERAVVDKHAIGWSPDLADAFLLTFSGYNTRQGRDVVYDIRSWPVRAECSASYAGVSYGDSSRWNASEAEFY